MQITFNIPDNYILYIKPEDIEKNFKLNTALIMYKQGKFSISQATDFSGIDIYEFILECKKLEIPVIDYSVNEIQAELQELREELK